MCCEGYWKKIFSFYLTFTIGILGAMCFSIIFIPQQITERLIPPPPIEEVQTPQIEATPPRSPNENLKCVPTDPNLKYRHLIENEFQLEMDGLPDEVFADIVELKKEAERMVKSGTGSGEQKRLFMEDVKKQIKTYMEIVRKNNQISILLYTEICHEIK